jgi:Predicted membrane protein (DUF2339)
MAVVDDHPDPVSFEERIGVSWLNKLGVSILVLGIASFLGYHFTALGALGKVLAGSLAALAMIAGGAALDRSERYRLAARGLIGGGWGLLYFVAYATYFVPAAHLIDSQPIALTLMLAVAAAMVVHTLRYEAQAITTIAFLLAFATVTLHHDSVFSLAAGAVLALALIGVVRVRRWFVLELLGMLATFLNHFLWLVPKVTFSGWNVVAFPELPVSTALLVFYWLVFRGSFLLQPRGLGERDERLTSMTAVLTTTVFLGLIRLQAVDPNWTFRWLLATGLVELSLSQLPWLKLRGLARRTLSTLGASLVVASVPFHFSGGSLDLMWLVQAEAMIIAGTRGRDAVLRKIGMVTLAVLIFRQTALESANVLATHDWRLAVSMLSTAAVLWVNAAGLRRWHSDTFEGTGEGFILRCGGYAAAFLAFVALAVPSATWTATLWTAAALALAIAARALADDDFAMQALGLGVIGTLQAVGVNSGFDEPSAFSTVRAMTIAPIVLLQYAMAGAFGRRTYRGLRLATVFVWTAGALAIVLGWYDLPSAQMAPAWAAIAAALTFVAWQAGQAEFIDQGALLVVAAAWRAMAVNLFTMPAGGTFWQGRTGTTTLTALALAVAFAIARRARRESALPSGWLERLLGARPDDVCFFATVTLATSMLAVIPPHGLVTLSWGLEGLVVFLVALWAGVRRYRLTGLGLLLLCVARVGIDVWAISAQERWITLVVLGALLMLVSFLYSRYRETLRRYL